MTLMANHQEAFLVASQSLAATHTLPLGWEERQAKHGRRYFVHVNSGTATYDDPRTRASPLAWISPDPKISLLLDAAQLDTASRTIASKNHSASTVPSSNVNVPVGSVPCDNSTCYLPATKDTIFYRMDAFFGIGNPDPIRCQHVYVDKLTELLRSAQMRSCANAQCRKRYMRLGRLSPRCPSWPGVEGWIRQLMACYWSPVHKDYGSGDALVVFSLGVLDFTKKQEKLAIVVPSPNRQPWKQHCPISENDWRHTVNLLQLTVLFTWLHSVMYRTLPAFYMAPKHALKLSDDSKYLILADMLLPDNVEHALQRARHLGLCPQRVWASVSSLPNRELILPVLIPAVEDPNCRVTSHGNAHNFCTLDFCQQSNINSTKITQLHLCGDSHSRCRPTDPTMFDTEILNRAESDNRTTAWSLDGRSVLPRGGKYMAISHVWSDGTGMGIGERGRVNTCLYEFFRDIARHMDCDGFWWDAICIPSEKNARAKAINNMHLNYSEAFCTVVHDRYLSTTLWSNAESGCFSFIMSPWFTRGWTALELAKSEKVMVLFGSSDPPGYVLKDLDREILQRYGQFHSLPCRIATATIDVLRGSGVRSVDGLLMSLGSRTTSWSRDRAIISGLLAGSDIEDLENSSQREIYRRLVFQAGSIRDTHFFHRSALVPDDGGLAWLPHDLYDLPPASSWSETHRVLPSGDVVGFWGVLAPTRSQPKITDFIWGQNHPITALHVKKAMLMSPDDHIILTEKNIREPVRGLYVKVIRKPAFHKDNYASQIICCSLVGQSRQRTTRMLAKVWEVRDVPRRQPLHMYRASGTWGSPQTGIFFAWRKPGDGVHFTISSMQRRVRKDLFIRRPTSVNHEWLVLVVSNNYDWVQA